MWYSIYLERGLGYDRCTQIYTVVKTLQTVFLRCLFHCMKTVLQNLKKKVKLVNNMHAVDNLLGKLKKKMD